MNSRKGMFALNVCFLDAWNQQWQVLVWALICMAYADMIFPCNRVNFPAFLFLKKGGLYKSPNWPWASLASCQEESSLAAHKRMALAYTQTSVDIERGVTLCLTRKKCLPPTSSTLISFKPCCLSTSAQQVVTCCGCWCISQVASTEFDICAPCMLKPWGFG